MHFTLTLKEAEALDRAAGNIIDHSDAMEATFLTKRERTTAYRAAQKLHDAIVAARRIG